MNFPSLSPPAGARLRAMLLFAAAENREGEKHRPQAGSCVSGRGSSVSCGELQP